MATYRKNIPAFDQVAELLRSGRLKEACAFLSLTFARMGAPRQVDDCKTLQDDYDRLLSYFTQGISDPHRADMYDSLMNRAWDMADQMEQLTHPEGEAVTEINFGSVLTDLATRPNDDTLLNIAFEYVAECHQLPKEDRKALHQTILDEQLPEYVRATLLGAVTLYLAQWFDAEMIENLYIYTLDDHSVQIQMQAWVTLVFAAIIHRDRIEHLPRLREQYTLLTESEPELLFQIQIALLQCREALNFNKKLHEMVSTEGDDEMPKTENIKEIMAFVSEGIDMSIETFQNLCGMPFFSNEYTRHHWLEPFSTEQPTVKKIVEDYPDSLPWINMMKNSAAQCETDKYGALICMFQSNNHLMSKLSRKLEATGLKFEDVRPLPPVFVMRNYLHDLFRYCHIHPQALQMRFKPFEQTLNLSLNPWLRMAFNSEKSLERIAEFLFRKERWDEAIVAYQELLKKNTTLPYLQRIIYSAMQAADPKNGVDIVEMLVKCNHLYPGDKWTLKNLAELLHAQGTYDSEELYLNEALSHHPKDVNLLMRMGRCLNCQGASQRALDYLFEADLEKEGQLSVQRELARALLMVKRADDAERYIRMVLSRTNPTSNDWLLAGHIALLSGNIILAIERYQQAKPKDVESRLISTAENNPLNRAGVDVYCRQLTLSALQQKWQEQDDNSEINN